MARLGKRERAEKRRLLAIAEGLQKPRHGCKSVDGLVTAVGDYGNSMNMGVQGRSHADWSYNGRRSKHGKGRSVEK